MSDESPELRWLIDRNHAETREHITRIEAQVAAIPDSLERYVLQRVYDADERRRAAEREADRGRIKALEEADTSQAAGGRAWVLGISLAAVGAAFGFIAQLLTARGGH